MSRKGNCWGNAVAESFFRSLKKERIKKQIYRNRELAIADMADYIDTFYNRVRRHSHLGGLSPEQFEAAIKHAGSVSTKSRELQAHRERVPRRAPEDLVFGNRRGDPMRESKVLRNVLQPAAEAVGLGRVIWHQFRHIHSSLLNDLKVPVKIAQEQLGHASISTTLNIYTHVVDASHRRAVEDVERRLFGDVAPTGPKFEGRLETAKPVSDTVN